jgi:hypothetical protein
MKKTKEEMEVLYKKYQAMADKIATSTMSSLTDINKPELEAALKSLREYHNIPAAEETIYCESPFAAVRDYSKTYGNVSSNAIYGQFEAPWVMRALCDHIENGPDPDYDSWKDFLVIIKETGWLWLGDKVNIVCPKPTAMHTILGANNNLQLHCETGPAYVTMDGDGVYALFNQEIPPAIGKLLELPRDQVKPEDILGIQSTEIRGRMLRVMGPDFLYKHAKRQIMDTASLPVGGTYELYKVDINGLERVYLTGVCPSKGDRWHEAVHPEVKTVVEANNWRWYGTLAKSDWKQPVLWT